MHYKSVRPLGLHVEKYTGISFYRKILFLTTCMIKIHYNKENDQPTYKEYVSNVKCLCISSTAMSVRKVGLINLWLPVNSKLIITHF